MTEIQTPKERFKTKSVAAFDSSAGVGLSFDRETLRVYKLLRFLTFLVLCLMALGATVRNLGAGLSCPDWPLCFGKLIPPMDLQIFSEWFHRLVASIVSFTLLGVTVLIFRRKPLRKELGKLNGLALLVLAAQVVLGGLTVLGLLKSEIVTSHLGTGFLFFGVLLWITLKAKNLVRTNQLAHVITVESATKLKSFSHKILVVAGLVYGQVLLGGSVASNYAGLACKGFPLCNGELWPSDFYGNIAIQVFHRIGAMVVLMAVAYVVSQSLTVPLTRNLRNWVKVVALAVCLQVCLGIGSVFMGIPVWMSVSHLAVGALLFGSLLVIGYESNPERVH